MRTKVLALLLALVSCKNEASDDRTPPPLGARIHDRVGRAAINTALIGVVRERGEKNDLQEQYNRAPPERWTEFVPEIAQNLGLYDALDAECGNQLLASSGSDRYRALALLLADDRIALDTSAGACNQYLAVELGTTNDCGGRTPAHDVIDVTYSALALGATTGVSDGIDVDPAPLSSEFPYFGR